MKMLLKIYLASSFISAVSSLMCHSCSEKNSDTCTGREVHCKSSTGSCISSQTVLTYGNSIIKLPQKSCGFPKVCNLTYSVTVEDVQISVAARCCKTDNCNVDTPQVAPRNMTTNGLECPSCFEKGLNGCIAQKKSLCTGMETKCIKFSGYLGIEGDPVAASYQGCATPSSCLPSPRASTNRPKGSRLSCTEAEVH
ncbi:phospholipase A2 inhibitor gamma subunit B-like [Hyperolius riggenbachi]|uniref:phospholipase A2 inhibitor gamma subunit B-like n=1 Tax=Hyperolius riggenbachi TaxID=752182 RepID=UPI0035A35C47